MRQASIERNTKETKIKVKVNLDGKGIYNVSTGIKTSVSDLLNMIKKNIKFKVKIKIQSETPGDQFGIYSIPTKLKNDLKIKKFTRIEYGLKKMINSINQ